MNNFFRKRVILGKPLLAFLVVNGFFVLAFVMVFFYIIVVGKPSPFPIAIHVFPFPMLLIHFIWMENVADMILEKIEYDTDLKYKRMKKVFTISKWCTLCLSLLVSISIILIQSSGMSIDFMENPYYLYPILIIGLSSITYINISYYFATKYLIKLIHQTEAVFEIFSNKPLSSKGHLGIQYFKLHKRIQQLLIAEEGIDELDWRKDKDKDWEDE